MKPVIYLLKEHVQLLKHVSRDTKNQIDAKEKEEEGDESQSNYYRGKADAFGIVQELLIDIERLLK